MTTALPCPCNSGKPFSGCCAPFLAGDRVPATAEALMRSRYTGYTRRDVSWLLATWHPSTRPHTLEQPADPAPKWIGLDVRRHEPTGADSAIVEFVARYRVAGRAHRLHETSRFVREEGRWYYLDGTLHEA